MTAESAEALKTFLMVLMDVTFVWGRRCPV